MRKLLPPHLFVIFVLAMGFVCWFFGFTHLIKYPYNLFGLPLLIAGLLLAQLSKNHFRKVKTNVNTFEKPDLLITKGYYRFSRNPMYLGFVIALLGFAFLYQGSISSFLAVLLFIAVTDRWYIQYEERIMLSTFGAEYAAYCNNTRRWI
jgi:protein-S-isoprenylcysteine O-methyltransferase Ste14